MLTFLTRIVLALRSVLDSAASREAEILVLRQQLMVLNRRSRKRVRLRNIDRLILVWRYRIFPSILDAVVLVKPETVIRWHRRGVTRSGEAVSTPLALEDTSVTSRAVGYTLTLLTIAAAILRVIFLDSKSFWLDEGVSATLAAETLHKLTTQLLEGSERNMALYYFILHWWSHLAGSSEIALRLLSVIFAIATVPLIYVLGAEIGNRRVGLLSALLLTINVTCIQYAQDARSYTLLGMLVTLSTILLLRSIQRSSFARCTSYVIVASFCTYTHLFGILVLPAQWISLFLFRTDRQTRIRLTACVAAAGILSLPPVLLSIHGDSGQVSWITAPSAKDVLSLFGEFAGLYWGYIGRWGTVLFALYLAAIGIALAGASERDRPAVNFLLLSVVLPVCIALAVSIFKPLFVDRYLLICLPFFVVLAAMGIAKIRPRLFLAGITLVIIALSFSEDLTFYGGPPIQDWRAAINFVAVNAKPGDVLVAFPEWNANPVNYYVGRLVHPPDFRVIVDHFPSTIEAEDISNDRPGTLRRFLAARGVASHSRTWIVTDNARREELDLSALEAGHLVTPGPTLPGLILVLVE